MKPYVVNLSNPEETPEKLAQKLNTLDSALDVKVLRGDVITKKQFDERVGKLEIIQQGTEDRIVYNLTNGSNKLDDQRYHGSGLSSVTTDGTLTGNGTIQSPLHVVASSSGGLGTVTSVSFVSASGFTGTVASSTTTPAIKVGTTVTGILVGNGSIVSAAGPSDITGALGYTPYNATNPNGYTSYTTTNARIDTGWKKSGVNVTLATATDLVGIGTVAPINKLTLSGDAPPTAGSWTEGQFEIYGSTNTNKRFQVGIDTSSTTMSAYLQAVEVGSNVRTINLNPQGGSVAVGSLPPSFAAAVFTVAATSDYTNPLSWANAWINSGNTSKFFGEGYDTSLGGGNGAAFIQAFFAGSTANIPIYLNPQDGDVFIGKDGAAQKLIVNGKEGIGVASPTARLHLIGSTTTASTAPIKFTVGTAMTSPEAGAIEFTNSETGLTFTAVATRRQFVLDTATQTLTNKTLTTPVISSISNTGTLTLPTATDTLVARTTTDTLTNNRITKRTGTTTSSATPTINTDNVDFYSLTAQAADITSFTTNLSGTPTEAQTLWIAITGTAARAITWGTSFEASTVALPTTTVTTNRLDCGFVWNTVTSKWRIVATA